MLAHGSLRTRRIARDHCLGNFDIATGMAALLLTRLDFVELRAEQIGPGKRNHPAEFAVASHSDQQIIKSAPVFKIERDLRALAWPVQIEGDRAQSVHLLRGSASSCGQTRCQRAKRFEHVEQIVYRLAVQRGNEGAAKPRERDDPVRRQVLQPFAQRAPAHAEPACQVAFDQMLARHHLARPDTVDKPFCQTLDCIARRAIVCTLIGGCAAVTLDQCHVLVVLTRALIALYSERIRHSISIAGCWYGLPMPKCILLIHRLIH